MQTFQADLTDPTQALEALKTLAENCPAAGTVIQSVNQYNGIQLAYTTIKTALENGNQERIEEAKEG